MSPTSYQAAPPRVREGEDNGTVPRSQAGLSLLTFCGGGSMALLSSTSLAPGMAAPDFTLPDQHGKGVRLSDLRGKRVVLYFFPKADTPG
jgi:hypothetical protein